MMCEREAGRISFAREVVRGLVLRALVGDLATVEAAKLYYVDGLSPSEIVSELKLRLSSHAVRGRVSRLAQGDGLASARAIARVLSRSDTYQRLLEIKPLIVKHGDAYRCLVCGRAMGGNPHVHILQSHPRLLEELVEEVLHG